MILNLFLFWRLGLFLITFLGSKIFPLVANQSPGAIGQDQPFNYWLSWAQWDGGNYLSIANHGYQTIKYFAFAPLFPMSAKALSTATFGNVLVSGLVIANLASIGFLFLFYSFLKNNYSKSVAKSTLVTFLVFPTTFFTVAYYSESLFLLFTIIFFIFLKKGDFAKSALVVIFVSLTRFIGMFLVIPLFYSYFASIKLKPSKIGLNFLSLFVSVLGIVGFMVYLKLEKATFLQFLNSQSFWQRAPSDPFSTIFTYFWSLVTLSHRPFIDYFDFLVTIVFIALLISGIRKVGSSLWIFSALAILIPASTGTLSGIPRYALASLGAFIIIGQILEQQPKLKIPFWSVSLLMQAFLAILFINGYWVA